MIKLKVYNIRIKVLTIEKIHDSVINKYHTNPCSNNNPRNKIKTLKTVKLI